MTLPKYSRLDPGQRRDEILDAASALLAERPYDEVSIEDIASAAGVTRGLVHHYFGGRNELYLALLRRLGSQREDELRLPVGSSARARVADTVSRWLDWTEANRTIWLATSAHGENDHRRRRRRPVGPRRRAAHHLSPRPRRGLPATPSRARVLDRAEPRRDTTLAATARRPATRHTSCSPQRSNTSCAPSALPPRHAAKEPLPEPRDGRVPRPKVDETKPAPQSPER